VPGADDERAELTEAEVQAEEDAQMTAASAATVFSETALSERELALLDEMTAIAGKARSLTDGRMQRLIDWVRDNLCPELGAAGAKWNQRRVLIFTEYTDTKRYLEQQLEIRFMGAWGRNDGRQLRRHLMQTQLNIHCGF
jgi:ERCC4-related helicase